MQRSSWYYEVGNERLGPVSLDELKALVQSGKVQRQTRVWTEGVAEPVAAGSLAVLFPVGNDATQDASLKFLVPVGRSGWAIGAGYLALFGMFVPFLCFLAIICAILGVSDIRKHPQKLGWGRIIFAFIVGGIWSLIHVVVFVGAMSGR
jgi:hypothetical protein